jgi:hypothetical protein
MEHFASEKCSKYLTYITIHKLPPTIHCLPVSRGARLLDAHAQSDVHRALKLLLGWPSGT